MKNRSLSAIASVVVFVIASISLVACTPEETPGGETATFTNTNTVTTTSTNANTNTNTGAGGTVTNQNWNPYTATSTATNTNVVAVPTGTISGSVNGYSFTNDWACRPVNGQWCMNPANLNFDAQAWAEFYDGSSPSMNTLMTVGPNGYCMNVPVVGQFDMSYGRQQYCANKDLKCWATYLTQPYTYAMSNKQYIVQSSNGFGCRGIRYADGSYGPAPGLPNF